MSEITVKPAGRRHTRTWPDGTTRTGYDVIVTRDGGDRVDAFVADTGRGWIIVDAETGETIYGLGQSTRIGPQRESALWLWQLHLNDTPRQGTGIAGSVPS